MEFFYKGKKHRCSLATTNKLEPLGKANEKQLTIVAECKGKKVRFDENAKICLLYRHKFESNIRRKHNENQSLFSVIRKFNFV